MRQIAYTKSAKRELQRLPKDVQRRIVAAAHRLASTGHGDVVKLSGMDPAYRLRVGTYRVLFDYEEDIIVIKVIRHRRESYA